MAASELSIVFLKLMLAPQWEYSCCRSFDFNYFYSDAGERVFQCFRCDVAIHLASTPERTNSMWQSPAIRGKSHRSCLKKTNCQNSDGELHSDIIRCP